MGKAIFTGVTIAILAVLTHLGTVYILPQAIMARAMHRIGENGLNNIHFQNRPDENSRGIVRPSPDLLYSVCAYDLSAGPLRVRSPVPNDTYWSVSLFDDATNNFYALNDRQAHAGKHSVVDFIVVQKGSHTGTENLPAVESPTVTGLVLFRTLIADQRKLKAIDALRREASCSPWRASLEDVSSKK